MLAFGFQAEASPVEASSAAMRFRFCPPMVVKSPPAYTVEPLTASARTVEYAVAFGSHALARPVVALSAAMVLRDWPPIAVNMPPA